MDSYMISVVIPVYNGEKFLRECLDSVLVQTFTGGIEIILVDDGSKDSSGSICDQYADKYNNIMVIHQDNGGVTAARRNGVLKANGEWITFVDADDTLPQDAIENLVQGASDDTDIVMGNANDVTVREVTNIETCRHCMVKGKYLLPALWGKLIRKELINEDITNIPREIRKGEDQLMNIRLLFATSKMPIFITKNVYNYRRNTISVSHTMKASVEYEAFYDKYRLLSIPASNINEYMHDFISIRLNGLVGCAISDSNTLCDKNQPFIKQLRNDIKRSKYKMNLQEWLMLNIRWKWMYKLVSFLIMVKNSLRYRLGLNN